MLAYLNNDVDPEDLSISTPVHMEQGTADTTVFPSFTGSCTEYPQHRPAYKTYDGIDHGHVVTGAPAADAIKWIRGRLPSRSPGCSRTRTWAGPPAPSPARG